MADAERLKAIWVAARSHAALPGRACPGCEQPMRLVSVEAQELDVCPRCQLLWFDGAELDALAATHRPAPTAREVALAEREALPLEAREALARMRAEAVRERTLAQLDQVDAAPATSWQRAAAYLGLPAEIDEDLLDRPPWATWILGTLIAVVGALGFYDLPLVVRAFGFVPSAPHSESLVKLFTSVFVHAGVLHLAGNLYFFFVFGDNVEDILGWRRFLLLFFGASVLGALLHAGFDPRADTPLVGASGGISGILAFYTLELPRARIGFTLRLYWKFIWVRIPMWAAFGAWLALQLLGAWAQLAGCSTVSAFGHLGGAAVGAMAWWAVRYASTPHRARRPVSSPRP
jgi:membrane associated rhomboid family serine protease/Zn-finger nucleic acid-binding protein